MNRKSRNRSTPKILIRDTRKRLSTIQVCGVQYYQGMEFLRVAVYELNCYQGSGEGLIAEATGMGWPR